MDAPSRRAGASRAYERGELDQEIPWIGSESFFFLRIRSETVGGSFRTYETREADDWWHPNRCVVRLVPQEQDYEMETSGPFALNEDGTAKDPKAFQEALRSDERRMEMLQKEPDVAKVVLGDDMQAFQELLKEAYKEEKKRMAQRDQDLFHRGTDAQRASARAPQDAVSLYASMRESGLQYGPAFQLLQKVHVSTGEK